jgi:xanthine dehydrogenase YagS FAD-binding subunit
MNPFSYARADGAQSAVSLVGVSAGAKYLGGGTNLVDLMRETIERPDALVDVTGLSQKIEPLPDGSVLIGAAVKNTALAADRAIRKSFPVLSRAILSGASGQIRNMATVGGNILQRTRCTYFFDEASRCNKRVPGTGCDALEGFNRNHAILGASRSCVATHPSDMCVALAALDAVVHIEGPHGNRSIELADLHRLPGITPDVETELLDHELITAIALPAISTSMRSTYRKVRDRASYAFALVSVAAAIDVDTSGVIGDVRLALGGVAHKPWRAWKAEEALRGQPATEENFHKAAQLELADAVGLQHNSFKIDLAQRTIVAVLGDLLGGKA